MRKKHWQGNAPLSQLFMLFSFFFFSFNSFSQNVSGTVTDLDNKPVSNVTVQVKGTSRSVLTNDAGQFSIAASGTDVLVFSHISYLSREVPVNLRQSVSVTLAIDSRDMQDVVVTALGIRKESKKLGYAATAVNAD